LDPLDVLGATAAHTPGRQFAGILCTITASVPPRAYDCSVQTYSPNSTDTGRRLRLLTFNIQSGTPANSYREYLTSSWRQVLPSAVRVENLEAIAGLVMDYDMVGLQEVDSGSLRSGFINQSRYIATHAALPYWFHQSNRKVGTMAYSGNGFLSRFEPDTIEEHRLPGAIPGRGALFLNFGGDDGLTLAVVHLALGQLARGAQLKYLVRKLRDRRNLVVMGDFNAAPDSTKLANFCDQLDLEVTTDGLASYPSWKPQRALDHVLVSRSLDTARAEVIDVGYSDHLPVGVEIALPGEIQLRPATPPLAGFDVAGA
jgi:endonuclease/exonuclease/phosphatase family metal-dependent hydrolase